MPDGISLAMGTFEGRVGLWDMETHACRMEFKVSDFQAQLILVRGFTVPAASFFEDPVHSLARPGPCSTRGAQGGLRGLPGGCKRGWTAVVQRRAGHDCACVGCDWGRPDHCPPGERDAWGGMRGCGLSSLCKQ